MAMNAIRMVLNTCRFTEDLQADYLINDEGLDCWNALRIVDFEDFSEIGKPAAKRYPDPLTIGAVKVKALNSLKFWIEDKQRINELVQHGLFT